MLSTLSSSRLSSLQWRPCHNALDWHAAPLLAPADSSADVPRDEHYGFQLYQSDPSGNYGGWKAVAIGAGHQAANNQLKTDFKDDITMAVGACCRSCPCLLPGLGPACMC